MSMIKEKNISKQSVGDGNRSGSRPGTRRNSAVGSAYGSSTASLLWGTRNSIAFKTGRGGFKVPRYQNTYQLESLNPLKISVIDKILSNVMNEQLKNIQKYDPVVANKLSRDMGMEIRKQIFKKNFTRYKYIVSITIIEKQNQAVNFGMGFLWDHERDNYSKYVFENPNYYAIGVVAGVYYE